MLDIRKCCVYFSPMLYIFRRCCIFFGNAGHIWPRTPCLGDLAWEILPGPMCPGPGPWSSSRGPGPKEAHGPRCSMVSISMPAAPWSPSHGPRCSMASMNLSMSDRARMRIYVYIYIYIFNYLINFIRPGTPCPGHLAWEILPGSMGPGPWARARSPRQGVLGKVS